MKKLSIFSVILVFTAIVIAFVSCDSDIGSVRLEYDQATFVEAKPDEGFNYGYYYYVPQNIRNAPKKYLLMQGNNSGSMMDSYDSFDLDDIEIHTQAAFGSIMGIRQFARELNCVLMVPVIPRAWNKGGGSVTDHQILSRIALQDTGKVARLDLQVIAMIDDLKALFRSAGINLEPKILLNGYSASGTFSNRFTALYPHLVQAVASGGTTGMPVVPIASLEGEKLIYPVGTADLDEITGTPFNLQEYIKVPQFIYGGGADTNNSATSSNYFGEEERRIIAKVFSVDKNVRWAKSIRIYEEQGCSFTFRIYPGVGHDITNEMFGDIFAFFRSNM